MAKICLYGLTIVSFVINSFGKYQDLTWVMDERKMSYIPLFADDKSKFRYEKVFAQTFGNLFLAYNSYFTAEHMGTHIDAPYHTFESGRTIDEVPLDDLIGPLVRIDIRERAALDRDTMVSVKDLQDWEKKYGKIPDRAFVLMNSGWDRYFGENLKYIGTDKSAAEGGMTEMHFPGFGKQAAQWLVDKRNIRGIGVDVGSCDAGISEDGGVHQAILTNDRLCIENMRNLDKVPECGARLMALPIMMRNGTGTQARILSESYAGIGYHTTCNSELIELNKEFLEGGSVQPLASKIAVVAMVIYSFIVA